MRDHRIPSETRRKRKYRCPHPRCNEQAYTVLTPDCPKHKLQMEESD